MMRYLLIVLLTCAWLQNHAQVNIITTIAGTGETGYSGDNGPATNAKFDRPSTLYLDKSGNIYTTDAFNHVVRKISLSTGIVTTIAGTGVGGYNGDNIPATDAQLYVPQGICADTSGNLYIADGLNARIRKISITTGLITTIAGKGIIGYSGDDGPATDAKFDAPIGMSVHGDNLFICDYNNVVLRKINLTTGIISHVAGTGIGGYSGDYGLAATAQLNGIIDVLCNANGDLYISEETNGVVRKINAATGIINTIAGNGTLGYDGDNGPATAAKLNEPGGLFLDAHNNLFISDYRNGAIRRMDGTTGIITTVAGGAAGYGGDNGPATNAKLKCTDVWVDNGGNIYIADLVNQRIRKVNGALKVNNLNVIGELALYPNPTTGKFEVQSATNEGIITVCNMGGNVVYQSAVFSSKTEVDISNQPLGMYMVYVQSGEDRYVSKVLLQ